MRHISVLITILLFPLLAFAQVKADFINFSGKTQQLCIRGIAQSADGTMWLAAESGLYSFDGYHLVRHPFMQNGKERRGLGSYNKVTVQGDSLIVVCNKATLSYNLRNHSFRLLANKESEVSLPVLHDGKEKWIGTFHSLQIKENGKLKKEIPMPVVKSIAKGDDGSMFVGTDNGLFVIRDHKIVQHFLHDTWHNSLPGDAVWCIFTDKDKNTWLGTNSGLSMLAAKSAVKIYPLAEVTGESMGNMFFVTFCDSKRRIWLGGSNGLICIEHLDGNNQACRWYRMDDARYSLPHNRIRAICETNNKELVIGTDGGMLLYDETRQQFEVYKVEGDPHDWIYEIRNLAGNTLLVTSYDGTYTVTLDRKRHIAKVLQKRDVPPHGESIDLLKKLGLTNGTYLSAYDDKAGNRIILGGIDRFSIIDKKLAGDAHSVLAVTSVRVNGEEFADIRDDEVSLPSSCRMIEIMFSDFEYCPSLPIGFQYSVDGEKWLPVNNADCVLQLTNLSYGSHDVVIRTADGKKTITLCVNIQSPWYLTWWAYCLYMLVIAALIACIIIIVRSRKRIAERNRLLASAKEKEKRLLSENEHLSTQLRIQMSEKNADQQELSADEQLLLQITTLIEENMSGELDVAKLSELSGIHSKQLYRKIKELTGMTTVAYIRDLRLKKAAALLSHGGFTVAEVMYSVGFSNPSYFTRCFQEAFGVSPSEYKLSVNS